MVHGVRILSSKLMRVPLGRIAIVAGKHALPGFTLPPRSQFFSSDSKDPALEDRALQESFVGLAPRFQALVKLFSNDSNFDMENLMRKRIVDPMKIIGATRVLVELQNPLLTKYKFDILDFAEGVKKAYEVSTLAAAKVVEAITIQGVPIDPAQVETSHDILKDVYSDALYKKLQIALEETKLINETLFKTSEIASKLKMEVKFPTVMLSKVNVNTVTVNKVSTRIIESQADDSSVSEEPATTEDLRRYKVGSVIASAEVFIDAEEEWIPSSAAKEYDIGKQTRSMTELWVFEGCISGQTPLEWVIKSMSDHKTRLFGI